MWQRIYDLLFTPHPYERNVLLWLAVFRAGFTASASLAVWVWWPVSFSPDYRLVAALFVAIPAALLSADFLEHQAKQWCLGYTYAPGIMATEEFEGGMTYLQGDTDEQTEEYRILWEAHKLDIFYYKDANGSFKPCVFWGDPASGHYGP